MNYIFSEHLHNYAVWTAARASQRGWKNAKTPLIKAAIDNSDLKILQTLKEINSPEKFDKFHRETAKKIIENLALRDIKTSYGRAAKIIAIYLKTSIIISDLGEGVFSKIIHPPIDDILLKNLNKANKNLGLKGIKWTKLTEKDYFEIIKKLRTLEFENFWELEKYWILTD
ncbi:MAG: hypothetical protein PF445_06505 [Melioribacteraceae bacterium]|jgi:hypothetical protein|nr:hypothetical protein [Melioribacteraceae bacterium]